MKKIILPVLALLFVASCAPKTEEKPPKLYTIQQFMDVVPINGGAFSHDETKILINSRATGIFNAVEIDVKTGEQKPLTNSTDNAIFSNSYFPKDNRVLYSSDKGGNEITHIFIRTTDGAVTDLIQDTTAKAEFAGWSYNQKLMYYASNSRDKRFFDLYKVQLEGGQKEGKIYSSTVAYKNEKGLNPGAISNDDRYISLSESITSNNSNMYLHDTQTGTTKLLSEHKGDVALTERNYFTSPMTEESSCTSPATTLPLAPRQK
jgi:Tol biopolymer transport system component